MLCLEEFIPLKLNLNRVIIVVVVVVAAREQQGVKILLTTRFPLICSFNYVVMLTNFYSQSLFIIKNSYEFDGVIVHEFVLTLRVKYISKGLLEHGQGVNLIKSILIR